MTELALIVGFFSIGGPVSDCTLFAGAAAGAGGYDAHQASEMDEVENDYGAGRISKQEYEARKDQIDESSVTLTLPRSRTADAPRPSCEGTISKVKATPEGAERDRGILDQGGRGPVHRGLRMLVT